MKTAYRCSEMTDRSPIQRSGNYYWEQAVMIQRVKLLKFAMNVKGNVRIAFT